MSGSVIPIDQSLVANLVALESHERKTIFHFTQLVRFWSPSWVFIFSWYSSSACMMCRDQTLGLSRNMVRYPPTQLCKPSVSDGAGSLVYTCCALMVSRVCCAPSTHTTTCTSEQNRFTLGRAVMSSP